MSARFLNSQRFWSRDNEEARDALLDALRQLQPGQRLRLADVRKGRGTQDQAAEGERADAPPLIDVATVALRAGMVDPETREVEFSFSSEAPYERWWGIEILGHGSGEVDTSWVASGRAPFLSNHDTCEQIGIITRAWLDSRKKQCRAVARFGKSDDAEAEMQDAQDGVRVNISVGYEIRELELVKKDGDVPTYRVTDWLPLECSLVSIPADMTVGLGRSVTVETPAPAVPATPAQPRKEQTMTQAEKPLAGDEAFRANVRTIQMLAKAYGQYLKPSDVADAVADGADTEKFNALCMERVKSGATDATTMAAIGVTPKEQKQYSFLRMVQSQIPGMAVDAGFEKEISTAIGGVLGKGAEGLYVPVDVMLADLYGRREGEKRDFNVGTSSQAGNLVQTSVSAEMWTDVLRPWLVLAQLGVTILPGLRDNLAVPRKTVAGTLAALTEVAAASETQPTTALPTLSPKRISAFVEPSKQAIIQSTMAIEPLLRQDLMDGAAVLLENQGINGDGSSPNARGIRNVSGIGSVVGGTNGANWSWALAVALETACANANAQSGVRAGYLSNTKVRGTSKTTQKASNLPFMWDNGDFPLNGYRAGITNNVPSNLTKGTSSGVCSSVIFGADWSMFVMGLFGGLDITVDPYTLATTGQIRITLNQYFDFLCRQPGAFASADDILTP